ncbi:hypothetical protein CY0110_17237 [Crocosphaera chwakensis CCY0110]|uniref:Uncharacterized protein n=1 Tax=Crocosphaera chwakensis CCY0110 TaxID=391612 RepID=A3IIC9_9CHRO|nr:hypothetical protein CY0110_17237 [Crocosphaera chwakensis CCY0110]
MKKRKFLVCQFIYSNGFNFYSFLS